MQTKRAGLSVGLCLAAVLLLSVGPALLAGVSLSCCFPGGLLAVLRLGLLLLYRCFWGSLLCFLPPSSCPRGLRWLVSLQVSPWFISCHDMFWLHASPALFSWAGRVCGPSQKK